MGLWLLALTMQLRFLSSEAVWRCSGTFFEPMCFDVAGSIVVFDGSSVRLAAANRPIRIFHDCSLLSLASYLSATSFQSLLTPLSVKVSFLGRVRGSESPDEELFLIPRIRALPSEIHLRAVSHC